MRKIAVSLALAAAAAAWATPAAAGSPASVYQAGRCLVSADRMAAVDLLNTLPLDSDPVQISGLSGRAAACMRGVEGVRGLMVRGALAQALFFRDFRRMGRPPQLFVRIPNLNLPLESSPPGSRSVELYRWSDCVVRHDTRGTERLLRSEIGSDEESAALESLRNFMGVCMPNGVQLSMARWEVRSLFAQSAYHTNYRYFSGQISAANPRSSRN